MHVEKGAGKFGAQYSTDCFTWLVILRPVFGWVAEQKLYLVISNSITSTKPPDWHSSAVQPKLKLSYKQLSFIGSRLL